MLVTSSGTRWVSHTCGTALLPNIPLRMARQRPTITSSLMFSMMPAASPAIRASRMGAAGEGGGGVVTVNARVSKAAVAAAQLHWKQEGLLTFVEVPEEEEFPPAGRGGADVTEKVDAGVPEDAVEAQHHLQTGESNSYTRGENCSS